GRLRVFPWRVNPSFCLSLEQGFYSQGNPGMRPNPQLGPPDPTQLSEQPLFVPILLCWCVDLDSPAKPYRDSRPNDHFYTPHLHVQGSRPDGETGGSIGLALDAQGGVDSGTRQRQP